MVPFSSSWMEKIARSCIPARKEAAGPKGVSRNVRLSDNQILKKLKSDDAAKMYMLRPNRSLNTRFGTPLSGPQREARLNELLQLKKSRNKSTGGACAVKTNNVDFCNVCKKRVAKRKARSKGVEIFCIKCSRRVHKKCLKAGNLDFEKLAKNYKCAECRTCNKCDAFADCDYQIKEPMIICKKCFKAYHLTCHIPRIRNTQNDFQWTCVKCQSTILVGDPMVETENIRQGQNIAEDLPISSQTNENTSITVPSDLGTATIPVTAPFGRRTCRIPKTAPFGRRNSITVLSSVGTSTNSIKAPSGLETSGKPITALSGLGSFTNSLTVLSGPGTSTNSSGLGSSTNYITLPVAEANDTSVEVSVEEPAVVVIEDDDSNESDVYYVENEASTQEKTELTLLNVPDVRNWKSSQVFTFFKKLYPKEAYVFKEQDIDGQALLMVERCEFVKNFGLKLGPSLRVFNVIYEIQKKFKPRTLD